MPPRGAKRTRGILCKHNQLANFVLKGGNTKTHVGTWNQIPEVTYDFTDGGLNPIITRQMDLIFQENKSGLIKLEVTLASPNHPNGQRQIQTVPIQSWNFSDQFLSMTSPIYPSEEVQTYFQVGDYLGLMIMNRLME